ncbi:MAG: SGNH/GDSL hydrolase family protein [Bacteroidetes bacterium]|nr:SGNH/GDSL hydrolase family protein [Bacteroidota bacterium]MBK8658928.1 SGNH/GDSL hydrolase family protein [Bacteroidota bacterium]
MQRENYTLLCLGDSYTIGEAVEPDERFPMQAVALLSADELAFDPPHLIAKTGWTTDELKQAIAAENIAEQYDVVTLLIGVNNQYRNRSIENYQAEFSELLNTAIGFCKSGKQGVFVLSIPDWGVTPFALKDSRGEATISEQIKAFNAANKAIATQAKVHYIDITPGSQKAKQNSLLLAQDGLHPSGLMYSNWAAKLAAGIHKQLSR